MTSSIIAPAKVNLYLHVGPAKANGRHDLDSLVVFAGADAADRVGAAPADALTLDVDGPGADEISDVADNLMLRAAMALQAASGCSRGAHLTLTKHLPVAAGIGGGSADAAAALRLLTALWGIDPSHAAAIAPSLGGDVPVALGGAAALMRGEGERVDPVCLPAPLAAVLVNPRIACPTGPVFKAFDAAGGGRDFREQGDLPDFRDAHALIVWLRACRNDLELPAIVIVPEIGGVLDALRAQTGTHLARMSGSGATCFGLYSSLAAADSAARALRAAWPAWWIESTLLGDIPS